MALRRRRLAQRRRACGYSQEALAEALQVDRTTVVRWETADTEPQPWHRPKIARLLELSLEELHELLIDMIDTTDAQQLEYQTTSTPDEATSIARDRRRAGPTAVPSGGSWIGRTPVGSGRISALVATVTGYRRLELYEPGPGKADLVGAVAGAKRAYQAGRYGHVAEVLPRLLQQLQAAAVDAGHTRPKLYMAAADAYQVACSVLLKHGEVPIAVLAADRSRSAAKASGDPVTGGASDRAVTHALLAGGHYHEATEFALASAASLRESVGPLKPAAISVYGALLLRAAVAAAHDADRSTASQLLDEADAFATCLSRAANTRWTYFNPVNVSLHRVHIAGLLGDAGLAVDLADRIDIDMVELAERQASLFIDVASAYTQWGKHEEAYQALCAAERAAPQEVAVNRTIRHLVLELDQRSPPSIRTKLRPLARRIGAVA